MQTVTTIGLDIAKSVFQVHDAAGQVVKPTCQPQSPLFCTIWKELPMQAVMIISLDIAKSVFQVYGLMPAVRW